MCGYYSRAAIIRGAATIRVNTVSTVLLCKDLMLSTMNNRNFHHFSGTIHYI